MASIDTTSNHQIRLAARPAGLPQDSDWELTEEPVPDPRPGEFVAAVEYVSIDPAMRRWIAPDGLVAPPVAIANAVCDALAPFGVEVNATPVSPEQLVRALKHGPR